MSTPERISTVVIGGGQAGLAVGYYLRQRQIPFVILEGGDRVGDSWRRRWDSLRLFTPSFYNGLPGRPFPGSALAWPSKDEMGDYLEDYARHFRLPVRLGTRATQLLRQGNRFLVTTSTGAILADQVVVAMSSYQRPKVPAFARELDSGITQLHSREYRNPDQLAPGPVLVVGAGNSGADIALELVKGRQTILAGRDVGAIPFRIETLAARYLLLHLVRFLGHRVLTIDTPLGRKARERMLRSGTPLVRVKPRDLVAAGVERVPRVAGVREGLPLLQDGRRLDVRNVIWATGFVPDHSWIRVPGFGTDGDPKHRGGIVDTTPGLYFVGLHFQYAATSATVNGVGRDAERIVRAVARRRAAFSERDGVVPLEAEALSA